ncbi:MAG: FecR family protein, partial [Gemmatimonadaceae bacterium]
LVLAAGAAAGWRARESARAGALAAAAKTPELREFATARGQRATIRLVDGTRVELGYASRLRVAAFAPAAGRREMYLEGEAVFDVVHDPARPFVVHAGNAVTEDLGTVFGVRAYPGDAAVRVLVVSGEVALRPRLPAPGADSTSAVLGGGQLGRLDARGRVEVESGVDTTEYLGWLSGHVSFHDAPLSEVAAELARRFDVTVTIADPRVAARRVTVEMPGGSLTQILDAVTTPIALHHRRDAASGTVVIEP